MIRHGLAAPDPLREPASAAEGGGARPIPPANPSLGPATSRRDALRGLGAALAAHGIPDRDARFLLLGVLDLDATGLALHGERPIGAEGAERLADALHRRLAGEPVARILGAWEFWGLPFRLSPETLVPRPDTETLVEAALTAAPDRAAPLRILDLGTGSGCVLVALLSALPRAAGLGLDRSEDALRTARGNAEANDVADRARFVLGDWCDPLAGGFDLVVSNPPYIESALIPGLDREVRAHDPVAALDGGRDGLDAYRRILAGASPGLLAAGGSLHLEIGHDQAVAVAAQGRAAGLAVRAVTRDLAGHDRVVSFRAGAAAGVPVR